MECVRVAGVDGCRAGWIVVHASIDPGDSALAFEPRLDGLVDDVRLGHLAAAAIDMPIGLPDGSSRPSDAIARARLGARRSTLFPTPIRAVLACETYEQANAISRAHTGKGLSKQAFHLLPKIRHLDALLRGTDQPAVFEAHPELSFAELCGEPLPPKTTAAGIGRRIEALHPHFPDLLERLGEAPAEAELDDVLDAYAVTWTARRAAAGSAIVLGDPDARDAVGRELVVRV